MATQKEDQIIPSVIKNEHLTEIMTHFSQALEELRPSSELDSRSNLTLLTSLALIGLSIASQKPAMVMVFGFAIYANHWLYLGIPLALIVIYAVVQLILVWLYEKLRFASKLTISMQGIEKIFALIEDQYIEIAKSFVNSGKKDSEYLTIKGYFELQKELQEILKKAESSDTGKRYLILIKSCLESQNRVIQMNNIRIVMGLYVPLAVAVGSLLIFMLSAIGTFPVEL